MRCGVQVTHIDPSLTATREVVKASVFQFGHHLPTMPLVCHNGSISMLQHDC
jgi:hypothetical protein